MNLIKENDNIWQNNDLDPSTTSIFCVHRNQIENQNSFNSFIVEVEKQTKCSITVHGFFNNNEVIWIKIKNRSLHSRRNAFNIINFITKNSCKEIILPSLADHSLKYEEKVTSNKMVRSSTDYSIQSGKSESFSSVFSPTITKFNQRLKEEETVDKIMGKDLNNNLSNVNKHRTGHRYDLNFLLARSSVPSSKLMPNNWKHLNEKYPEVCFCGKIISYFDHLKYYSHLNYVQKLNDKRHTPSLNPNQKTNFSSNGHHVNNNHHQNLDHFFPKRDFNQNYEKNVHNKSHDFKNNIVKKSHKSFLNNNADLSSSSNNRKLNHQSHSQSSYSFNGFKREPVKAHFQSGYLNTHIRNNFNADLE